jgi:hypothetical protein
MMANWDFAATQTQPPAKKLMQTKTFQLVAVALANKMVRIAFAIVRGKTTYSAVRRHARKGSKPDTLRRAEGYRRGRGLDGPSCQTLHTGYGRPPKRNV